MNGSQSIANLAAALVKAQANIEGASKDKVNPHFKSRYADLSSVVDAIKGPITKEGLAYTQVMHDADNAAKVETIIVHSSGEWLSCGVISVPVVKNDAQGFGSALTYARRYSLSAAFGVAPEDDDGNAAAKAAPTKDVAKQIAASNVTPNADAGADLSPEQRERVSKVASEVVDCFEAGVPDTAFEVYEEAMLTMEEKLYIWTFLPANQRSALKKMGIAKTQSKINRMEAAQA